MENQNQNQNQLVPVIPAIVAHGMTMSGAKHILTPGGKAVGARMAFGEQTGQRMSAGEIKLALRKANPKLKGTALAKEVNAVLTGSKDVAWARHDAMVSSMRSAGFIPDQVAIRKQTGSVRYCRVAPVVVEEKKAISREEALAALGLDEAALAALVK